LHDWLNENNGIISKKMSGATGLTYSTKMNQASYYNKNTF